MTSENVNHHRHYFQSCRRDKCFRQEWICPVFTFKWGHCLLGARTQETGVLLTVPHFWLPSVLGAKSSKLPPYLLVRGHPPERYPLGRFWQRQSPGGVWLPPNLNKPQSYLEIARASFLTASVAILRIMCCENTCPPRLLSLLREQRWQNTTGGVTLDVSQGPTAGGLTVCDRSSHVFQIKPPRQVVQCHVVNLITRSQRVTDLWQSMM